MRGNQTFLGQFSDTEASWRGMAFDHAQLNLLASKPGVGTQTEHGPWLVLRRELFWESAILY